MDTSGRLKKENLTYEVENLVDIDKDLLQPEILLEWIQKFNLNLIVNFKEPFKQISKASLHLLHYRLQKKLFNTHEEIKQLSLMRALLIAADHIGSARLENAVPKYRKIKIQDFQPKGQNGEPLAFRFFNKNYKILNQMLFYMLQLVLGKQKRH